MSSDDSKNSRKKIALTEHTYDRLKTFSRFNGLKTRVFIDAMVDVVLQDEELSKRVVEMTLENQASDKE
ncbi:hypothetical protein IVG45_04170 [Methylomonas sp. LL1]|uniref:hypothetical protein n=1 Tax=Methylomonas sp. LL1 TaxID=2785785 RepID=UPI0018C3B78D|nr:hypothetical protein [Methylomonas sp. LL1]QPK64178.1 hypothetical protein IVG45_04170 [Methylomonas sp. LL1]